MNKVIGNYKLVSGIGQGQFGSVYKAHLLSDENVIVAVKQISKQKLASENPKIIDLFKTELAIMSTIKHPNIIRLIEFLESGNNYYLVMPFCEGGDLDTYISKKGRLTEDEALDFLVQIMNGFQTLYKHKIMHRDFKLANVFLRNGRIIIGDFGFAKYGADVTGTRLGTRATMAPEIQFGRSGNLYNNKIDLWSIGVSFYEMLFGFLPFDLENEALIKTIGLKTLIKNSSGSKLNFPPNVPVSAECKSLLMKMIEFEPAQRISWKDFFNHSIFQPKIENILKSMNKQESISGIEFLQHRERLSNEDGIDPVYALKGTQNGKGPMEDEAPPEPVYTMRYRKEGAINFSNERYIHEQKIVVFILETAKMLSPLENALEANNITEAANNIGYGYSLLIKKALLMISRAISSLSSKQNVFKQPDFDEFIKEKVVQDLVMLFQNEYDQYSQFLKHLVDNFSKKWKNKELLQSLTDKTSLGYSSMGVLDEELLNIITYTKLLKENLTSSSKDADQLFVALPRLPHCVDCERNLPFISNATIFDWNSFQSNFTTTHK